MKKSFYYRPWQFQSVNQKNGTASGSCCCGGHVALEQHLGPLVTAVMSQGLVDELGAKCNAYGDTMLTDVLHQIEQIGKYEELGLNVDVAQAIVVLYNLAQPTFGDVGWKFLQDQGFLGTKCEYAQALARHFLLPYGEDVVKVISHGLQMAFEKREETAEEAVVLNVINTYEFALQIDDYDTRGYFLVQLLEDAYLRTSQTMRLAKITLPTYEGALRNTYEVDDTIARALLDSAYTHVSCSVEDILPYRFGDNWGDMPLEQIIAIYVITRADCTLKDILLR